MCMGAKLISSGLVIVTFMCELDWAIGFPDILSNFIFSLSWYPFPNEINICISTVSTLPSLKQTVLIQSFEDLNRTKS